MARDFSGESSLNYVFRLLRFLKTRTRGRIYYLLRLFTKGTSSKICFGSGAEFINSKRMFFSENVSFGRMAKLECHRDNITGKVGSISFGSRTSFGDYFHASSCNEIIVGDDVLGSVGIMLVDHNHGSAKDDVKSELPIPPRDRPLVSKGQIKIGNGVWIGKGVMILSGVEIGDYSIIAANTIVRRDIPAHTVYWGQ